MALIPWLLHCEAVSLQLTACNLGDLGVGEELQCCTGTTLIRGVWIIGGMGVAMTDPGGKRTTEVIGGRGMTGTAETTAARTGGGICREKVTLS